MTDAQLPIESGSTGEWKTRIGIFFAMCTAFSLWFAYDGLVGYPKKNLETVRRTLPGQPADLKLSPKVNDESLHAVATRLGEGKLDVAGLEALLGPPAVDQNPEYTYIGRDILAVAQFRDGKAVSVTSRPATDSQKAETPNYRITPDQVGRVSAGMTQEEIARFLGEPTKREPRRLWFAGRGAYAAFEVDDNGTVGRPLLKQLEPSEGDIFIQKALAVIIGLIAIGVGLKWLRILRLHVRLDESGLTFNKQHIAWEQMTAIDTDQYLEKGWLDLLYTENGREEIQRIDSYHVDKFREIVRALCERKGFSLPMPATVQTEDHTDADAV